MVKIELSDRRTQAAAQAAAGQGRLQLVAGVCGLVCVYTAVIPSPRPAARAPAGMCPISSFRTSGATRPACSAVAGNRQANGVLPHSR